MVRGQTGLTEQEINDLGRSINIQQFDKPEEAERIIKAAEAQLPGSVDLYQDIRSQTGLNYAEIEDLAGSINIRNLDKPGEVTRIVEAHNTVNPTVPNPDDTLLPRLLLRLSLRAITIRFYNNTKTYRIVTPKILATQ